MFPGHMLPKTILRFLPLTLMAALTGACSDNDSDSDNVVEDHRIAVIDTNDDLVVSVSEWAAAFPVLDLNNDGFLDPLEFQFNAAGFAIADVNRSGSVSEAEWAATLTDWDTNGDHVIDLAEFDPYIL